MKYPPYATYTHTLVVKQYDLMLVAGGYPRAIATLRVSMAGFTIVSLYAFSKALTLAWGGAVGTVHGRVQYGTQRKQEMSIPAL